jgi:hypothetical protein
MASKKSQKDQARLFLLLGILVGLIGLSSGVYFYFQAGSQNENADRLVGGSRRRAIEQFFGGEEKTNTQNDQKKSMPLKKGEEIYNISQGAGITGPKIAKLYLNPLDLKKGQKQTLKVQIIDDDPIVTVSVTVEGDEKTTQLPPLVLTEGTASSGWWQTEWTLDDPVDYRYIITIEATSQAGQTSKVVVAPRS